MLQLFTVRHRSSLFCPRVPGNHDDGRGYNDGDDGDGDDDDDGDVDDDDDDDGDEDGDGDDDGQVVLPLLTPPFYPLLYDNLLP